MATSVGEIYYSLKLDTTKFDAASARINSRLKGISGTAEKTNGSMAGTAATAGFLGGNFSKVALKGGVVAGVIAAVGIAAKKTLTPMIQLGMETQTLRTNLDVLTGSAENGAKMFKKISDFAAKTPFEVTELVAATQQMLAMGIAQEDVMDNLQMLGDISLGNKEKLAGMTLVLGQISSKSRLTGEDLMQLRERGFDPLRYIVMKTGETMEEVTERVSEGKVSYKELRDAMKLATSEGQLFYGGMDKGSKTLEGRLSTLRDTAKVAIRALIGIDEEGNIKKGGIYDTITKAVEKLGPWLEKIANEWMPKVSDAISKTTILTSRFIRENQDLIEALKWVGIIIGGATLLALAGLATMILAPIGALVALYMTGKRTIEWLARTFENLKERATNSFWGIVGGLASLQNNISNILFGIWRTITGAFSGAWNWLYNAGRNIVQGLLNGIGSLASSIGRFFLDRVPGWIKEPFKKALGIRSPSKLFMGYGKDITTGLVMGLEKSQSMIDTAMTGMNNAVISPTVGTPIAAGGGSSVNNITIKLDGIMTESREGTRQVARNLVQALNEQLRAKNKSEIAI